MGTEIYSFSPLFSNLNNLNDDENETESDLNGNEISIINYILIYLNFEVFWFGSTSNFKKYFLKIKN